MQTMVNARIVSSWRPAECKDAVSGIRRRGYGGNVKQASPGHCFRPRWSPFTYPQAAVWINARQRNCSRNWTRAITVWQDCVGRTGHHRPCRRRCRRAARDGRRVGVFRRLDSRLRAGRNDCPKTLYAFYAMPEAVLNQCSAPHLHIRNPIAPGSSSSPGPNKGLSHVALSSSSHHGPQCLRLRCVRLEVHGNPRAGSVRDRALVRLTAPAASEISPRSRGA